MYIQTEQKRMLGALKQHTASSRFAESDDGRPVVAVYERWCAHGVCVYRVKQRDKRREQQVGTHCVPHTPSTDSFFKYMHSEQEKEDFDMLRIFSMLKEMWVP